MRPRVVVLGDALLDVNVSGAAPRVGSDVPAAIRLEPGGQGANLAVRLARRGMEVRLACALAHDTAGLVLRERLAAEGVAVMAMPAVRTGAVAVLVGPDGERSMLSQRVPLAPHLEVRELPAMAAGADWFAVSGYLLLEPDAAAIAGALAHLPSRRLVLGCAVDPSDTTRWRAAIAASEPTLLVLNGREAELLTGADAAAEAAHRLAGELSAAVVVTEPAGAVAVVDGTHVTATAPPVRDLIDTTGAGDAFAASLLGALGAEGADRLDARSLQRALPAAVEAGTAATRVMGAQGRIPGEDDPGRLAS